MMKAAIQFQNISKKFTLHQERRRSFQEVLLNLTQRKQIKRSETFWALKNVSFEVAQGDTVGLIGPNGAGKSTVLKLISRIIEPTSGQIKVNGQVGALLELGAGFHPELTGRENVYLNGSILGLNRAQIRQRLDAIVAFAEMEHFIDVPVKHYSSGMYVRLGFAVAAHTDPDILLVDEVLAVGDATFQQKCLDRINDLRQQGVTILFVSHNTDSVRAICSHVLWLDSGQLLASGPPETVVSRYLASPWEAGGDGFKAPARNDRHWGTGDVRILKVRLLDSDGRETQQFRVGDPIIIKMHYCAEKRVEKPIFGLAIHRHDGTLITGPNTYFNDLDIPFVEGEGSITYRVAHLPLLAGTYFLSVSAVNHASTITYDYHDRTCIFAVRQIDRSERYGLVSLQGEWSRNNEKGDEEHK